MASIIDNKLIFSEDLKHKVQRHLLFWTCWWFYFGILHAASSFGAKEIMYFQNLPYTVTESTLMMIPQVVIVYPMLYLILPGYFLQRKYVQGFILTVIAWLIGGAVSTSMALYINQEVLAYLLPERFMRFPKRDSNTTFYMGLLVNMKGGLSAAFFAVCLKLMKHFYLKEHRNLLLQKENTDAQMRLLTAQVHPHFLFNSLNNIFSQTQTESPKGSRMIMGLSDMLRYILYEGSKPLVPLDKELLMITEYINLEKIRYGNKLDVHVLTPDKTDDIYIAPLLLLPFIENCFKHGASHMLREPWINLTVEMKNTMLVMKLMNGKVPLDTLPNPGIGIANVRQRLELLYKDQYDLQIREDVEVFVVDLKVELILITSEKETYLPVSVASNLVYV